MKIKPNWSWHDVQETKLEQGHIHLIQAIFFKFYCIIYIVNVDHLFIL